MASAPGAELEIEIDTTACRGAGECVTRAGRTFALGDDERAQLLDARGDADEVVIAAARACPHFAIRVLRGNSRLV